MKEKLFDRMSPMLREWYWEIQRNRMTEEQFVVDMVNRFELYGREYADWKIKELLGEDYKDKQWFYKDKK